MASTGGPGLKNGTNTSVLSIPVPVVVEGVPNFRDLGGLVCYPYGKERKNYIRRGYLFRAAQPTNITPAGIETLTSTLNITHVYDLRSLKELRMVAKRFPEIPLDIPGVHRQHVPVYKAESYAPISTKGSNEQNTTMSANIDQPLLSEAFYSHDVLVSAYRDIVEHAAEGGSFRTIMMHIFNRPENPLLWHCMLGKDRTGVFTALLLKLCGVDDDAVVRDYLLTTTGLGKWRQYLVDRLVSGAAAEYRENTDDKAQKVPPSREEAEEILTCHAKDMCEFLSIIKDNYGSARGYFRDKVGLTEDQLSTIIKHLVSEDVALAKPTSA